MVHDGESPPATDADTAAAKETKGYQYHVGPTWWSLQKRRKQEVPPELEYFLNITHGDAARDCFITTTAPRDPPAEEGMESEIIVTAIKGKLANADGSIQESVIPLEDVKLEHLQKICAKISSKYLNADRPALLRAIAMLFEYPWRHTHLQPRSRPLQLERHIANSSFVIQFISVLFSKFFRDAYMPSSKSTEKQWPVIINGVIGIEFFSMILMEVMDGTYGQKCGNNFLPCADPVTKEKYDSNMKKALPEEYPMAFSVAGSKSQCLRKSLIELLRVRRHVMNAMARSNIENPDPYHFVANALAALSLEQKMSPVAAYYFIMQCQFHPEMTEVLTRSVSDCLEVIFIMRFGEVIKWRYGNVRKRDDCEHVTVPASYYEYQKQIASQMANTVSFDGEEVS